VSIGCHDRLSASQQSTQGRSLNGIKVTRSSFFRLVVNEQKSSAGSRSPPELDPIFSRQLNPTIS
jgi:hypothetical protein